MKRFFTYILAALFSLYLLVSLAWGNAAARHRLYKGFDVTVVDSARAQYVTAAEVAAHLSKYIKEKSGMTFGEFVKKIRMKKARALLKSSNMTVENIALSVGYQNVEHFNRLFKKAYNMTPMQFRNQK